MRTKIDFTNSELDTIRISLLTYLFKWDIKKRQSRQVKNTIELFNKISEKMGEKSYEVLTGKEKND